MTNESHQFPAIFLSSRISESRHARKSHAILDNPEKFAVGKCLRLLQSQIGRLGIQAFSKQTVTAAVIAMATRAMIREMQHPLAHNFIRTSHGINLSPCAGRYRKMPQVSRNPAF